jgi:hypothetical protein
MKTDLTKILTNPGVWILIFFCSVTAVCSCSKRVSAPGPVAVLADSTITDTSLFIYITLDNNRILRIENGEHSPLSWGTEWGTFSTDSSVFPYNRVGSAFFNSEGSYTPSFEFGKGNYYIGLPVHVSSNFTDSFFAPGNYNYSVKTTDTSFNYLGTPGDTVTRFYYTYTKTLLSPGINLLWIDSAGTEWETFNGSADQTNSYFTITKNKALLNNQTATAEQIGAIITATFDCKLYDNQGHVMHLTNGQFRQWVLY